MSPLVSQPNRGYADWQRVDNWDTGLLWNVSWIATLNGPVSPVIDVSRSAYLGGYLTVGTGAAIFTPSWYDDANMDDQLAFRQIVMSQDILNNAQIRIPNLGPFVRMQFNNITGANIAGSALVYGTNRYHPLEMIPSEPYLHQHTNNALAANATNYYLPSDYYAGPIYVSATSPLGFNFRLEARNTANGWDTLAVEPMTGGASVNQTFIAPPGVWRVGMQQTTGVATSETLRVSYSTTGSS